MNFVSHQNFCFASLDGMVSLCSSEQLPKSVGATLLQLHCSKEVFLLAAIYFKKSKTYFYFLIKILHNCVDCSGQS